MIREIRNFFTDSRLPSVMKKSWSISWPMTLIMLYEFLIGITDVYIAGKFGKEVQASYGLVIQLYFVFLIVGFALNVGTVSVISRMFTSGDPKKVSEQAGTSLISALTAGAIFSVLGWTLAGVIVAALKVPQEIKGSAVTLLRIYSVGFAADYLLMNSHAVLRACDRIKFSLITSTFVCLLNVVLDIVLSLKTPLGYRGLGIGTVIALSAGCLINYRFMIPLLRDGISFSAGVFKRIARISWPSGLLHVLWQSGSMVLFLIVGMLPRNSVAVMAALTGGLKVESVIFLPIFAFNMANAVIVGNAIGKGRDDDAYFSGKVTAVIGISSVIALTILVLFNAESIASLLTDNALVKREMIRYIRIALIFEPVLAWGVILSGALNGAGDTKTVMFIVGLAVWIVRIPLCYVAGVVLDWGPVAIWWVMNLSVLVQTVLFTKRYAGRRWLYIERV